MESSLPVVLATDTATHRSHAMKKTFQTAERRARAAAVELSFELEKQSRAAPDFEFRTDSRLSLTDSGLSLTIEDFSERFLRPAFVTLSRDIMYGITGIKVTTLVWFNGRYRAMPRSSAPLHSQSKEKSK